MILAIVLVAFLSPHLTNIHAGSMEKNNYAFFNLFMAFLYAQVRNYNDILVLMSLYQSLTLPLQGFMNAIVYGWTREDFVQTIAINNMTEEMNSDVQNSDGTELNESRREQNFEETLALSDSDNQINCIVLKPLDIISRVSALDYIYIIFALLPIQS